MARRTDTKVRGLDPVTLGIPLNGPSEPISSGSDHMVTGDYELASIEETLPDDSLLLLQVQALRNDGYAGVILSGPPGTGKTWMARKLAFTLVERAKSRTRFIQFHPSYQYEDFIQGYVPREGGFEPEWKAFGLLCIEASDDSENLYVMVIDEFSRTDAARVFGEALTYIEGSKRGIEFRVQSGDLLSVPANLFLIATMNPWDRGVDELDIALERRFATMDFPPDVEVLSFMLESTELSEELRSGVTAFFSAVQKLDNEYCHIGQAYFNMLSDEASLDRLWVFRLHPHFSRAARSDKNLMKRIESMWSQMVRGKFQQPSLEAGQGPEEAAAAT